MTAFLSEFFRGDLEKILKFLFAPLVSDWYARLVATLEVRDLNVSFGKVAVLRGVNLSVDAGQTLGIVGESGCGKSMTGLAILGMLPPTATVNSGEILLEGKNLVGQPESDWLKIRGEVIAMVMQDPFTSLNPMMRVGDQVAEVYVLHQSASWKEGRTMAVEMLEKVGIPSPNVAARKFPHQMSGGQRQRVVIACAFAARPKVLIADEPTTALDVTLQAQILHLLRQLQAETGTATIVVSHDIGVIGSVADKVSVFYAGRVVEEGETADVLTTPAHPYTQALLSALPRRGQDRLEQILGQPPRFDSMPKGCSFSPRCKLAGPLCETAPESREVEAGHLAACWKAGAPV